MFTKKIILFIGFVGLLFRVAFFSAYASPVLSIDAPRSVELPAELSVNVRVNDVMDLYALQFDLTFNSAVLSALSITEGPFLPTGGTTLFIPGSIDNTAGTITLTIDTLLGPPPPGGVNGSGIVATIEFSTKAAGTSLLSLENVILLDSNLSDISFTTAGAILSVIPEPKTDILFMTGFISLVGLTWYRRTWIES